MASHTLLTDDEDKVAVLKMAGVLIRTAKHPDGHLSYQAWKDGRYFAASLISRENCIHNTLHRLIRENQNEQANTN